MIDIGSTSFLIKVPSLPEKEFELYSSRLFDQWERSVEQTLFIPDYSISLEIEEGSISGRAKVAATVSAIYISIASYGGFISGVQTIRSQISYANSVLFENAKSPFSCNNKNTSVRNNGGSLSKLQSLFFKVQKGVLTADEAMLEARALFGDEGEKIPGFINKLKKELENAPKYPEQLRLIDEDQDECNEIINSSMPKPSKKRTPQPIPASQQFKIEIWRESKNEKKHVKFTKN
jgi:hypothetical protein